MTSKLIIRVLMCSTFIAGSGAILQSCIFDPGARTLFASEEPARKTTPAVRRVATKSTEPAFARSDNGAGGNSSSGSSSGGGMGGGSDSGSSGGPSGGGTRIAA